MCDRKNQLGSLKMLSDYMREHRDVVFMYAGGIIDADYQASITQYAKQNDIAEQVIYAGELAPGEELNIYYNMADCCVFTSVLESFGLVIIEAISSGTPVVLGSNLMFDLDSGYSMYHSEDEFVSMVDAAITNGKKPRDEYKDVLDKYSWDSVAMEHGKLFFGAK